MYSQQRRSKCYIHLHFLLILISIDCWSKYTAAKLENIVTFDGILVENKGKSLKISSEPLNFMKDVLRIIFLLLECNNFITRFVCRSWAQAYRGPESLSLPQVIEYNSERGYFSILKWLWSLYPVQ